MQAVSHQNTTPGPEFDRASMVRDLSRASAYPHPAKDIKHIETHTSDVFLAGEYAYKIKKPVRFEFLDFTSDEQRLHFSFQELQINEDLASGIYEGMSEVCLDDGDGYSIDTGGRAVEFAIRMKRLPDEARLDLLLENGEVTTSEIQAITQVIVNFHAGAERSPREASYDFVEAIRAHTEANFEALLNSEVTTKWEPQILEITAFNRAFLEANESLLIERAHKGFVRDCHGDIHAGNIFLTEQTKIIDRIEFNPAFRTIDVASDAGFLTMDIARIAGMETADIFVDEYARKSGDSASRALLPFFAVYRAMVRAKVMALRLGQASIPDSERTRLSNGMSSYFDVAIAFMNRLRPRFLLLMCGLSGTGKSTLARELARSWHASRISSDRIRRKMVHNCEEQLGEPLSMTRRYSSEMTEWVYQEMCAHADRALQYRPRVIMDATFSKRSHRFAALRIGRQYSVPAWLLHSTADNDTLSQRLDTRSAEEADGSEATSAILDNQAFEFEDVRPDDADHTFAIQTTGSVAETVASAHRQLWNAVLASV